MPHSRPIFDRQALTKPEWALLLFAILMFLVALLGPHTTQFEHYHNFADQRSFLGIPCTCDVLSNLPFTLMGILGLLAVRKSPLTAQPSTFKDMCFLFFYGLIITSIFSSVYHLNANNSTLWLDRMGMTVAFAGMLGVAASNRISARAGKVSAYVSLILAPLSLWVWQTTDNLLPWAVFQLGGMLIILALAFMPAIEKQARLPLAGVIGWYALAKVLELGDYQVYEWTGFIVSGHTLKHIAAAMAAWPVIAFLRASKA